MRTYQGVTDQADDRIDWEQVLSGTAEAFGRLFDRHRDRVYRHACRLVDTREDAEDVLAVAYLELWRLRTRVRIVDGSILPWLLATTTNVALNHRRSTRRYRAFLSRLPREESAQDAATESMHAVDLDIDPTLLREIRHLPDLDQRLVALVAFESYSLRGAAEALGITTDAARSRWQRVRRRLAGHAAAMPVVDTSGGCR